MVKSLVWMLNQQDDLRRASLEGNPNAEKDELPVLEFATVGTLVWVYSAAGTFSSDFVSANVLRLGWPCW